MFRQRYSREKPAARTPEVFVAEGERTRLYMRVETDARGTNQTPGRKTRTRLGRSKTRVSPFATRRLLSARIRAFGVTEPVVSVSDHGMGVAYGSSSGAYRPEERLCSRRVADTHTHTHTSSRLALSLPFYHSPLFPRFSFSLCLFFALGPT